MSLFLYTQSSSLTIYFFFFFNDTATTEIYTLSLHDALPISPRGPHSEHTTHQTTPNSTTSCQPGRSAAATTTPSHPSLCQVGTSSAVPDQAAASRSASSSPPSERSWASEKPAAFSQTKR